MAGLESANSGNCEEAFICFETAARHGYSKAHFNTGVCYEMGRGVRKDKEKVRIQTAQWKWSKLLPSLIRHQFWWFWCFLVKALHHYWQAAAGGHRQAQYRHAKLLLTSRGQQSLEKLNTAIGLLEQSAASGLTKVEMITMSYKCYACSENDLNKNLYLLIKCTAQVAKVHNKSATPLLFFL